MPLPPAKATIGTSAARSTKSPAGRITSIVSPGASASFIQFDIFPPGDALHRDGEAVARVRRARHRVAAHDGLAADRRAERAELAGGVARTSPRAREGSRGRRTARRRSRRRRRSPPGSGTRGRTTSGSPRGDGRRISRIRPLQCALSKNASMILADGRPRHARTGRAPAHAPASSRASSGRGPSPTSTTRTRAQAPRRARCATPAGSSCATTPATALRSRAGSRRRSSPTRSAKPSPTSRSRARSSPPTSPAARVPRPPTARWSRSRPT